MTNRVMLLKLQMRLLGLCTAALLLAVSTNMARAYDPTARISIAGTAGLSLPSMSDVNDRIGLGNAYMAEQDWISIDEFQSLFSMGYEIRGDVSGNWMLALGGGQVFGNRGVDFDEVIDIEPTASVLNANVIYRLPWRPTESIRLAAGAGFVTTSSASMKISHEHRNVESGTLRLEQLDLDLSGNGAQGFLEAEFIMTERFTLSLEAGYRHLETSIDADTWSISRLGTEALGDADGDDIQNFEDLTDRSYLRRSFLADDQIDSLGELDTLDPEDIKVDFSGPSINIALRVYLF